MAVTKPSAQAKSAKASGCGALLVALAILAGVSWLIVHLIGGSSNVVDAGQAKSKAAAACNDIGTILANPTMLDNQTYRLINDASSTAYSAFVLDPKWGDLSSGIAQLKTDVVQDNNIAAGTSDLGLLGPMCGQATGG